MQARARCVLLEYTRLALALAPLRVLIVWQASTHTALSATRNVWQGCVW